LLEKFTKKGPVFGENAEWNGVNGGAGCEFLQFTRERRFKYGDNIE
jgi:hypothetical protein